MFSVAKNWYDKLQKDLGLMNLSIDPTPGAMFKNKKYYFKKYKNAQEAWLNWNREWILLWFLGAIYYKPSPIIRKKLMKATLKMAVAMRDIIPKTALNVLPKIKLYLKGKISLNSLKNSADKIIERYPRRNYLEASNAYAVYCIVKIADFDIDSDFYYASTKENLKLAILCQYINFSRGDLDELKNENILDYCDRTEREKEKTHKKICNIIRKEFPKFPKSKI